MSLFDLIYKVKFNLFKTETFDDFADRLSFKFSCLLLLAPSVIISFKQYFVRPISCYIATEPGGKYLKDYMENYCFVEGTIPVKFSAQFPSTEKEWKLAEEKKILYYQWIPFILTLQALGCYIPQLIWRLFYINNSGKEMESLISKVNKATNMDNNSRSKEVNHLAKILEGMILESQEEQSGESKKSCFLYLFKKCYESLILGKRLGAYLMLFYLLIKILYLINSVGQLFFMQTLLCWNMSNCTFLSRNLFSFFRNQHDWEEKSTFPRIGYCRAQLQLLGGSNFVVAQCSLPINMLNENVYVFLWYWMLILSIITFLSIIRWIFKLFVQHNKTDFLIKYLKVHNVEENKKMLKQRIKRFERKFLNQNGFFILKMIAENSGDLIVAEIVTKLYDIYKIKYSKRGVSWDTGKSCEVKEGSSLLLKLKNKHSYRFSTPNAPCDDEKD